jgi:protein disulfide-isomerase A1
MLRNPEDGNLVLTDANFEAERAKHANILVFLYEPFCPFSRKLLPEFATHAARMREQNPSIVLAKVDGMKQEKLIKNVFKASGFPTFFLVKGDQIIRYD